MRSRLELKISANDKDIIKKEAKSCGLTVSAYVRYKLLKMIKNKK